MNTQDGYDWPTPRPVAPDYIAQTEGGALVIVSQRERLFDSGMTFRGVPLMFERDGLPPRTTPPGVIPPFRQYVRLSEDSGE